MEPLNKGKKINSYYFLSPFLLGEGVLPQSVGANIRERWGKRGVGGDMQTIAVCRLTRKADLAIISLGMKYHFMEGRFCLVSL
jgi:hypothetical protein